MLVLAYRHIKWGLVSKLLQRAFSWHPWIPGTLKLDSILSLFKCVGQTSAPWWTCTPFSDLKRHSFYIHSFFWHSNFTTLFFPCTQFSCTLNFLAPKFHNTQISFHSHFWHSHFCHSIFLHPNFRNSLTACGFHIDFQFWVKKSLPRDLQMVMAFPD